MDIDIDFGFQNFPKEVPKWSQDGFINPKRLSKTVRGTDAFRKVKQKKRIERRECSGDRFSCNMAPNKGSEEPEIAPKATRISAHNR